jgi:hypothetical protein
MTHKLGLRGDERGRSTCEWHTPRAVHLPPAAHHTCSVCCLVPFSIFFTGLKVFEALLPELWVEHGRVRMPCGLAVVVGSGWFGWYNWVTDDVVTDMQRERAPRHSPLDVQ